MNCLVGCASNFASGPLKQTVEGENLSPWIVVRFEGQTAVTVGNKSAPANDNTAVIKSFEFGMSNGAGCEVEILDEQGGSFHTFVERLSKSITLASQDYKMEIQFGWTIKNCDGTFDVKSSPVLTFLPMHIEIDFAEGKIKFKIIGTDLIQVVFVSRENQTFGTDENPMPLKEAIKQLFSEDEPKIQAQFLRLESDGSLSEWDFDGDVKGAWECDRQNKLSTAMSWISSFRTDRNKGIVPTWDCAASEPTVIFWEDPGQECGALVSPDAILGTWIVNGGKCSNVVSFTTKLNWMAAFSRMGTGGGMSPGSGETTQKSKACNIIAKNAGVQQTISIDKYAWNFYGPKNALKETDKSQNANNDANRSNSGSLEAIDAELRFQGDPSAELCSPKTILGKYCSIVVINPYHLLGISDAGCGNWLASPPCNEILSNRRWQIQGVQHSIQEGSYTTTLKVKLAVPGIDTNPGSPLGGEGSGGFTPSNTG